MCYSIARTLEMLATLSFAQAGAKTQRQRVVTHAQLKSCWSREDTSCTIIFGSKASAINGFEGIHNQKMIQVRILQHMYSLIATATAERQFSEGVNSKMESCSTLRLTMKQMILLVGNTHHIFLVNWIGNIRQGWFSLR